MIHDIKIFFRNTIWIFAVVAGCLTACDESVNKADNFDRQAMLRNIGENLILPGYENLRQSIADLNASITSFTSAPNEENLEQAKEDLLHAYKLWQRVSFYEFGPAAEQLLRTSFNSFPADNLTIEANIEAGDYNLNVISNFDAKGLPAIEYLLFNDSAEAITAQFTTQEHFENRQKYLIDVVTDMLTRIQAVAEAWDPSGENYLQVFINRTGTDVGSALGMLVNTLNLHYEKNTRDAKIGIPLGVRSLGEPIPRNVEAYFSHRSVLLALENLEAIHHFYLGAGSEDGLGLEDYLQALDAKHNNEQLAKVIDDQFLAAIEEVGKIPSPYSKTVVENPEQAEAAYTELQKLVVLLKVDMPSALGVLITYQDNDGD